MTDPRQLFILLGFLAQALTWDSYWFVAGVLVLWMLAVTVLKGRWPVTLKTEGIALVVGCLISFALSRWTDRSAHFFLGDGLILLQLVRLMRPLTGREKLTALIIAAFHFAVVCTLAPNVRFVLLFTGALFVLPGALKETFVESTLKTVSPPQFSYRLVPSARVAFWLLLGSSFAFLTAPRFTGSPLHLREGLKEQTSFLDSVLDPRRGGQANSQQVLMQVEGDNVGYMRLYGFTEFDGTKWSADPKFKLWPYQHVPEEAFQNNRRYLHRRVHVKNAHYLGKVVPVDGEWVFMKQNFFTKPGRNLLSGAVEPSAMWTTGNNVYEYYIDREPQPQFLPPDARKRLTYCPPQTKQLSNWLAEVTIQGTNALQKARWVEVHLRTKFTYQLGSPELKRIGAIDDFIFNRKEGHCERFAAAMGLFLRMNGIPSRVVVGYVPTTRNIFTGRLQVRFRDAHSWAEGYFEDKGWVAFDATPGPPSSGTTSDIRDMLEALDFAWYSHIVNFNGFAQRELLNDTARVLNRLPKWAWTTFTTTMLLLLSTAAVMWLRKNGKLRWELPRLSRRNPTAKARHYYDQMLQTLQNRGLTKESQDTPLEFLTEVTEASSRVAPEAAVITHNFCRTYYGEIPLTDEEKVRTEQAVKTLKKQCSEKA
jgi:transglutaminase-like putative cysteine protease